MVIGIPDLEFPIPSPVLELELQLQFRFFGMGGFHLAIGREASGKKILGGLCVVMMTSWWRHTVVFCQNIGGAKAPQPPCRRTPCFIMALKNSWALCALWYCTVWQSKPFISFGKQRFVNKVEKISTFHKVLSLDGKLEPCDVVVLKTILIAYFSLVDTAANVIKKATFQLFMSKKKMK